MKKYIFYLLFISISSFGQFKNLYPDSTSQLITKEKIMNDLLYQKVIYYTQSKGIAKPREWEFVSLKEFEEIGIKQINLLQTVDFKEYFASVKIICHDYKNTSQKFIFDLILSYKNLGTNETFKISEVKKVAYY
jgi:hypothetical protein